MEQKTASILEKVEALYRRHHVPSIAIQTSVECSIELFFDGNFFRDVTSILSENYSTPLFALTKHPHKTKHAKSTGTFRKQFEKIANSIRQLKGSGKILTQNLRFRLNMVVATS